MFPIRYVTADTIRARFFHITLHTLNSLHAQRQSHIYSVESKLVSKTCECFKANTSIAWKYNFAILPCRSLLAHASVSVVIWCWWVVVVELPQLSARHAARCRPIHRSTRTFKKCILHRDYLRTDNIMGNIFLHN